MKQALFSALLFLVPGLALAQEDADKFIRTPGEVVQANQIEVGLLARLLQAASIAFNPWQQNTRWPLYAYRVMDVRTIRGCENFHDVPVGHELAFVSPVGGDARTASRYIGVQVSEAGEIRHRCNQTGDVFAQDLDELLSITEARAENLKSGTFERTARQPLSGSKQLECERPFMTGTLHLDTLGTGSGSASAATNHLNLPLLWQGRSKSQDGPNMTLSWTAIPRSPNNADQEEGGIESLEAAKNVWRFMPEKPNSLVGTFFLSLDAPAKPRNGGNVTTLWKDGHIRWPDTPVPENDNPIRFTLWYMPLFCGSEVAEDWYLVSDRPLRRVSSDFRVNMSALDPP